MKSNKQPDDRSEKSGLSDGTHGMNSFCNPDVTVEAWYPLIKSSRLTCGEVETISMGTDVELALRRFDSGELVLSQRYCSHMGADLGMSKKAGGETFRCAFHGLEFNRRGHCVTNNIQEASDYHLTTFPVREKFGLIWGYLGEDPLYDLPDLDLDGTYALNLPSQTVDAHHHIVISNPLDKVHTGEVHSFECNEYQMERNGVKIHEHVSGKYREWWMMLLTQSRKSDLKIEYASWGPTISKADALWHNTRVVVLFTGRQNEKNECKTNTVVWLDSYNPLDWLRALAVLFGILKQDVDILNAIDVKTNYTGADDGMIAFTDVVNSMPVYRSPETS